MSVKEEEAIEAHHEYKAKQSEGTAREYRRHISRFRDYLEEGYGDGVGLFDCHSGHAEEYYEWMLADGFAPSSVRVAHASLSDFYDVLDKFGADGRRGFPEVTVETDPTEYASPERLDGMHDSSKKKVEGGDEPLTPEEIARLVENVPQDKPIRNELIVRLMYQTGVRVSELVRIRLDDINRSERKIQVYGKKTEDPRQVWYQPTLDGLLDLWIGGDRNVEFYAGESEYLFPTRRQVHMEEQTATGVVTQAAESAGLQETVYENRAGQRVRKVGAHTLRKSFGVHFINNGGDISFLMDLLGHETIEVTKENYLAYSEKDIKKSVERHGPSV